MNVDWADYVPFDPGVDRPLHEVTRREARAAFQRLMVSKEARIEQIRQLLGRNGVTLGSADTQLQSLNDWFRAEVKGDLTTGRLLPLWYAVTNDVALFLGDVIIERSPGLKWVMHDEGKRDLSYQRHVLAGFSRVPNPRYHVDIDLLLATYGHRVVARSGVDREAFVSWVDSAVHNA